MILALQPEEAMILGHRVFSNVDRQSEVLHSQEWRQEGTGNQGGASHVFRGQGSGGGRQIPQKAILRGFAATVRKTRLENPVTGSLLHTERHHNPGRTPTTYTLYVVGPSESWKPPNLSMQWGRPGTLAHW